MQVFNINDSYFKYMKCLSGITYQFVNQLSDIYQMNLMVGTNYCIYCMYNEFDIINNFMTNFNQVDVCSASNIDTTKKYYKIDEVPLKTNHRIILVGQLNAEENNIYTVDSRGYISITDDLRSGNTWRYKAYVKLGTNKGKQFHLKNVGNRFPIGYPISQNEKKEFLDGHGYIIKNYFNYNLFQTIDGIIPKLIFADYELARLSVNLDDLSDYPKTLWNGFEFPIIYDGGDFSIKYHDNDIQTIKVVDFSGETSYFHTGKTMDIINIDEDIYSAGTQEYGPETWIPVNSNIYSGTQVGDYVRVSFKGSDNLVLNTFVKRLKISGSTNMIVLKDYIPDNILNNAIITDNYSFRNLNYATEYIEDIRYWSAYNQSSYIYTGLTIGSFSYYSGNAHMVIDKYFYSGSSIGDSIELILSGNTTITSNNIISGFYNSGSTILISLLYPISLSSFTGITNSYTINNLEYIANDDIYTVAGESYFNPYFQVDKIGDKRYINPKKYDLNRYFDYDGLEFLNNSNSFRIHGVVKGSIFNVLTSGTTTTNMAFASIIYSGETNGVLYTNSIGEFDYFIKGGNYNITFKAPDEPYGVGNVYQIITTGVSITTDMIYMITLEHLRFNASGTVTDSVINYNTSIYSGFTQGLTNQSLITIYSLIGHITGMTTSNNYSISDIISGNVYAKCENINYMLNQTSLSSYRNTGVTFSPSLYPKDSYKTGNISGITSDSFGVLSGVTVSAQIGGITGITDSNGKYQLFNVPLNNEFTQYHPYMTHNIQFSKYGYTTLTTGSTIYYRLTQILNPILRYQKTVVEGYVRDLDTNEIVSGTTITLTGITFISSGYTSGTTTDSNGYYRFTNVNYGNYRMNYSNSNYISSGTSTFSISNDNTIKDIYIEHQKGSISGITLKIENYQDYFTFNNVHVPQYDVLPSGGTIVLGQFDNWAALDSNGNLVDPISDDVSHPELPSTSGLLQYTYYSQTGRVVEGATVTVTNGSYIRSTTTNSGGTYYLDKIRTGSRVVVCTKSGGYTTNTKSFISTGSTTVVDFLLDFTHNIIGSIIQVSGTTPYSFSGEILTLNSIPPTSVFPSSNNYIFSGVSGGTYRITYTNPTNTCWSTGYTENIILSGKTNVTKNIYIERKVPKASGIITSGSTSGVCQKTGLTFSVSPIVGATSYIWTVPAGVTIVSGAGTTGITVSASQTITNGIIKVSGRNACGDGISSPNMLLNVVYPPTIPGIISPIIGGYSINSVIGATSYIWYVPSNCTITGGQGTNSIQVSYGHGDCIGQVEVAGINLCGTGNLRSLQIEVYTPYITGPTTIAFGDTSPHLYYAGDIPGILLGGNQPLWIVSGGNKSNVGTDGLTISVEWYNNIYDLGTVSIYYSSVGSYQEEIDYSINVYIEPDPNL